MTPKRPSCDDYLRMPVCEAVIKHIKSCEKCRALVNALADYVDRRAYEFEHRN